MFCEVHGVKRQLSALRTPQQNEVFERNNRTIQEVARSIITRVGLPKFYQKESIHTIIYVFTRVQARENNKRTPYELWHGRIPIVKYFKIFESKCYIKRDEETLGKFDARSDEGIFLGYSTKIQAYRCLNKRLRKIVESSNVKVDGTMKKSIGVDGYVSNEHDCARIEEIVEEHDKYEQKKLDEQNEREEDAPIMTPRTLKYVQRNHS